MTEQPPSPSAVELVDTTLELRVLSGPQQGARASVDVLRPCTVGGDLGNDIVLRHSNLGDCQVQISRHESGVLVEVLHGEIIASGKRATAGERTVVPLYTTLSLGSCAVALGDPQSQAWAGLSSDPLAPSPATPDACNEVKGPAAQSTASDTTDGAQRPTNPSPGLRHRLMLIMGGLMFMACAGVGAYSYERAPAPADHSATQAHSKAQMLLTQSGYAQLKATSDHLGAMTITGYLETSAELAQLQQLLAREAVAAKLDINVNDRLVAAVQDVFRANQVAAEVLAVGPGAVRLTSREADVQHLSKVKATALRDIPGLLVLDINNTPPVAAAAPEPLLDDPGKRVSSIVPGDVAYVVTADGSRYFEGALLPTGQRITAIEEGLVVLERNGTSTTVRF